MYEYSIVDLKKGGGGEGNKCCHIVRQGFRLLYVHTVHMSKNKNMVTYSYIEITVHQQSKLYRLEAVKIKTNRELNPV